MKICGIEGCDDVRGIGVFCEKHVIEWSKSPERARAERIMANRSPGAMSAEIASEIIDRTRAAFVDFASRIAAERRNAGGPVAR